MGTYARTTEVPPDRSRAEIERTLQRYGAQAFLYGWEKDYAVIGFQIEERRYRISLPLPDPQNFGETPKGRRRTSAKAAQMAYDLEVRRRWRSMALWIKAVLEAAETGIITIEIALQPFIVLPNDQTVGEWLEPQIDYIYETGQMPKMLPGVSDEEKRLNPGSPADSDIINLG